MVVVTWPVVSGAAVLISLVMTQLGTISFLPDSCQRLEQYLEANLVGQDLAVQQLVTAVCTHLEDSNRLKPLVISVHGPPGVGKSYTHLLMARALYNKHPEAVTACPGAHCAGYKVIYGLHFPEATRHEQLEAVKQDILAHLKGVRDPLLVFEEYDKYDCDTRTWLRHLLDHAHDVDSTGALKRAIVLLESNLGYVELEDMLSGVQGDASKLTPEDAERVLRDTLFASWQPSSPETGPAAYRCEEPFIDTLRFTSLVSMFLPYLPLQRPQVEAVANISLKQLAQRLLATKDVHMHWDNDVLQFLASKVEFDGPYPLEGAKQVGTVVMRYVTPALRKCPTFTSWTPKFRKDEKPHILSFWVSDHRLLVEYPTPPS